MKNISLKILFLIVAFSVILGSAYNLVSPNGINIFSSGKDEDDLLESSGFIIPEIGIEQAENLLNSENTIFIDARDNWDYSDGHIQNAVNVPEYKFEELKIEEIIPDKSLLYIIYCSDQDCDTSKRLAEKLAKKGYGNLLVFPGGWEKWLESGLPLDSE